MTSTKIETPHQRILPDSYPSLLINPKDGAIALATSSCSGILLFDPDPPTQRAGRSIYFGQDEHWGSGSKPWTILQGPVTLTLSN